MDTMRSIFFVTICFFVIINPMVQSQDCCRWSEYFDSIECGLRQPGDQLLFNDIRSSNWTIGINNRISVDYTNIYITWWKADLSTNWNVFGRSVYYPRFWIYAGAINSTQLLTMNVTAYGYSADNIEVPYGCLLQEDEAHEKNTFTYHNPKYQ